MSLSKISIINDYDKFKDSKVVHPHYKFSCTKWWKNNDKCIIYKADKDGIVKLIETDGNTDAQDIEIACDIVGKDIDDNTIISGGHTVIDLLNRFNVGEEAVKSTKFSFELISKIEEKYNKKTEFMVQLNDLYMEQDMDMTTGEANKYREKALHNYVIPVKLNDMLKQYSEKLNRAFDFHYCAEKNMADRFKRHIKLKKKKNNDIFVNKKIGADDVWNVVVDGEEITVIANDKPNCVAANAAMLRSIRYEVDSNKIKDNFKSYIGIFPLCSIDNVLNGYKVANFIYDLDLPSYYIFKGKSCF